MRERRTARKPQSLAGQLLLAHPAMRDPNFRRTVVLVSAHGEEGAMGVVLNRPLGRQLAEINQEFALGPLAGVPLYNGGPVSPDQLIIVSWQWIEEEGAFQLQFGLDPEKAAELVGRPDTVLRAFLGYSGWGRGQLENEMKQDTWFVTAVEGDKLENTDGIALWRSMLGSLGPELRLIVDEPEDPTVN
ncbi:MAG TPA: YqgE/AlgH family protein [Lacunisphaera sp.]|jgi:putative transcriptional regulator|nr:YqgE/AlgH family protein [Lacunisphaera sp.]